MMPSKKFIALIVVSLSLLLLGAQAEAAKRAGRVMYAVGDASAVDTGGTARALKRGDDVVSGDRLVTREGRMQIRFSDGGLVSMQPSTEFEIADYGYDGKTDGSERGFFSLLRGGIRAVTGAIGRTNRGQYRVRTAFATIGIRGTTYKARVCSGDCPTPDGLYAKGGEGTIVVFNDGGEIELTLGNRAYVSSPAIAPSETSVEPDVADVPAPSSPDEGSEGPATDTNFVAGQAVFQGSVSGVRQVLPLKRGVIAGSGTVLISGQLESGAFVQEGEISDSDLKELNGSFNQDNGLIGVAGTTQKNESGAAFVTNVVEAQSNGVLYLGRWTNGTATVFADGGFSESGQLDANDSAHYVVGLDDVNVPMSGNATYTFSGLTTSSTGTDGSIGGGIVGGQVNVNFGSNFVTTNFDVNHDGIIQVSTFGGLDRPGGTFSSNGSAVGAGCNPSCGAYADGFLSGGGTSTPTNVGLGYEIGQMNRDIVGVGGFVYPAPSSP